VTNQVIKTRNVVFNENEVFQEDLKRLKNQLRKTLLEDIRKTLYKAMTKILSSKSEEVWPVEK
jgi:hypothetical protein